MKIVEANFTCSQSVTNTLVYNAFDETYKCEVISVVRDEK